MLLAITLVCAKAFEGLSQSTPSHYLSFSPLSFWRKTSVFGLRFFVILTNKKSIDKISTARGRLWRAEFSIIPLPTQFVNRQNRQKFGREKSRICAKWLLDFYVSLRYTIITEDGKKPARDKLGYRARRKRGVIAHSAPLKKSRKFEKTP